MGIFLGALQKHAALITNLYAVEEARRNLQMKYPKALPDFDEMLKHYEIGGATPSLSDIKLAEKDRPILGGAVAGNASHLLTGDERDFGSLWGKPVRGVKIVSPKMLADELVKKKRLT